MSLFNLSFARLAAISGFLTSVAVGCVITVGDGGKAADGESCPSPNSFLNDSKCFCNVGYDWCNEDDLTDLTCCENNATVTATATATNTNGNTDGNTNGTTSDVPTGGTTGETPTTGDPTEGTTGDPIECVVETTPPASCDEASENFLCIEASNPACMAEGSKYYECEGGKWVENTTAGEESCKLAGSDFSVGCIDDGDKVVFDCGSGPGTPCQTGTPNSCNGETLLEGCYYGKLASTDCEAYCMEFGDGMGVTYDYGFCGEQRSEIACLCCDEGDDGCPINEDTTGEGTTGDSTGG